MKLFISYGHDRTELVRRVAEELRERGHEVWMDLTDLKSGMDWRNEIARTITESQAVLVFLSAHALRKGGVCLDEISIAAACGKMPCGRLVENMGHRAARDPCAAPSRQGVC